MDNPSRLPLLPPDPASKTANDRGRSCVVGPYPTWRKQAPPRGGYICFRITRSASLSRCASRCAWIEPRRRSGAGDGRGDEGGEHRVGGGERERRVVHRLLPFSHCREGFPTTDKGSSYHKPLSVIRIRTLLCQCVLGAEITSRTRLDHILSHTCVFVNNFL